MGQAHNRNQGNTAQLGLRACVPPLCPQANELDVGDLGSGFDENLRPSPPVHLSLL